MFKLFEIEFINHPFFTSLKVDFVNESEGWSTHYTTLIIGPNGTGKSKLLQSIIAIFNSLESISKNSSKKYSFDYKYRLKFANKGEIHIVDYVTNDLLIDGVDFRLGMENISLPTKLLVSAFSFNDKYPLREQRGKVTNENYYYLGLKSTTNNIFIGNPTKNAIANLYGAVINGKDISPLSSAFTTLDLKPELTLIYKPGKYFKFLQNNDFWDNKNITSTKFESTFLEFIRKRRSKNSKQLGNEKIDKLLSDKEKIKVLIDYLQESIRLVTELVNKEIALQPSLSFEKIESFNEFTRHIYPFQLLSDLEIVTFQRFEIKKLSANFSFDDASSGEYHIILTYLNILTQLEENSLVILDEPEISLHPNWQIKYMDVFNRVFHHFPKSHFIIASHSHFLVSDLKADNSSILAIRFDEDGKIKISPTPQNTYGWSAEQILLDVFKVATTRNYYISKTITEVLKEMAEITPDYQLIKSKLESIIFLDTKDFNNHDPLLDVFKELKTFYNELN